MNLNLTKDKIIQKYLTQVGQFPTGILKSINDNYDEILQTEQSWDKIDQPFATGDQTQI